MQNLYKVLPLSDENSLSLLADSLAMKNWLTSNITILATLERD